jgi:hypothetical protein
MKQVAVFINGTAHGRDVSLMVHLDHSKSGLHFELHELVYQMAECVYPTPVQENQINAH